MNETCFLEKHGPCLVSKKGGYSHFKQLPLLPNSFFTHKPRIRFKKEPLLNSTTSSSSKFILTPQNASTWRTSCCSFPSTLSLKAAIQLPKKMVLFSRYILKMKPVFQCFRTWIDGIHQQPDPLGDSFIQMVNFICVWRGWIGESQFPKLDQQKFRQSGFFGKYYGHMAILKKNWFELKMPGIPWSPYGFPWFLAPQNCWPCFRLVIKNLVLRRWAKERLKARVRFWLVGEVWWMGVEPKIRGKTPQIIHFNRVFHYFHHPFWGVNTTIFGNTRIWSNYSDLTRVHLKM